MTASLSHAHIKTVLQHGVPLATSIVLTCQAGNRLECCINFNSGFAPRFSQEVARIRAALATVGCAIQEMEFHPTPSGAVSIVVTTMPPRRRVTQLLSQCLVVAVLTLAWVLAMAACWGCLRLAGQTRLSWKAADWWPLFGTWLKLLLGQGLSTLMATVGW